jgi:CBS domain-containing protein
MSRAVRHGVTAKDIMKRNVLTVDPQMTVQEVMQFFLERQITGAPVVDEEEKLVGVISQTDLLRYQRRAPAVNPQVPSYYHESNGEVLVSHMQMEASKTTRVRDIMTPAAFMTEGDTPVSEIARFMLKRRVHRIIVTRQGKLAGIITSMDLLRALLGPRVPPHAGKRRAQQSMGGRSKGPLCLHG